MSDRFTFEFSPDTTEQLKEIHKHKKPFMIEDCQNLCEQIGVRARVFKNGDYFGHIFEDGSFSKKEK